MSKSITVGITADYEGNKQKKPARRPASKGSNRDLEGELRSQLHQSRIRERTNSADAAEASAVHVRVRSAEVGVIEGVVRFQPQLKVRSFCNPRVLLDGEIEVCVTRTVEVTARNIAQLAKRCIRHRLRIEPVVILCAEDGRTRIQYLERRH